MPVPFLNSVNLNKNEVQNFKVFNIGNDPTPTLTANDAGYFWFDSTTTPTPVLRLKYWTGTEARTLLDSASTTVVAADLSGGAAGSLPYQQGANDTTFLGIGTAGQVLKVNSGATAPEWTAQSNLSVGTATFLAGGTTGDIPVQSAAGTTGFLNIGANGRILTSNGSTPVWSATIPSSAVSGLAASATTDTTNAANITSGLLPLARLELADGSFYVGNGSNVPTATAKNLIPISGFGAATAAVAMGNQKITGLADPVDATDAANRKYVDEVAQGLDVKASCLTATTTNINLSAPTASIGGVTISTVGSRVLVKDQTDKTQNGIYLWQGASSAMTRSLDADTVAKLVGAFTFVEQGSNADSGWVCQVDGGTIGSVDIEWTKFSQAGSYTAGNGMVLSGGVFHFAQSSAYTAGQIPFCSNSPTANSIGFSSNLFWDNANGRLGIGTPTPASTLHVAGSSSLFGNGAASVFWGNTSDLGALTYSGTSPIIQSTNATALLFYMGASPVMTLGSSGNLGLGVTPSAKFDIATSGAGNPRVRVDQTSDNPHLEFQRYTGVTTKYYGFRITQGYGEAYFQNTGQADIGSQTFTTRMTLDAAGRLGIGTPSTIDGKVHIYGDTYANSQLRIQRNGAVNGTFSIGIAGTNNTLYIQDEVNATARLIIDGSGNLGLGVTPSTWQSTFKVLQLANGTVLGNPYNGEGAFLSANTLRDSSGNWVRLGSGSASMYYQITGSHQWFVAGTGDSGAALSFSAGSQAMTLNASGNLGLGVTPSTTTLATLQTAWGHIYGHLQINLAQNVYWNSGWKYYAAAAASYYFQDDGVHAWYSSTDATPVANGTANFGSAKMTLDASGNLGVACTPSAPVTVKSRSADSLSIRILQSTGGTGNIQFTDDPVTAQWGAISATSTSFNVVSNSVLGLFSNATERLRLSSTGQALFSLNGTASAPTIANADNPDTGLYWPTDADTLALAVGGSDAVYIDAGRRVIIGGNAVPDNGLSLYVVKSGVGLGHYISATVGYIGTWTNNDFGLASNGTERLRITSTGEIRAVGQGTASAPIFSRTGDSNTGLYFPAADTLALATGGSDRIYLSATGPVGIGVTPSGWGSGAIINLPNQGAISATGTATSIVSNGYYSDQWRFYGNGRFAQYYQNDGAHIFFGSDNNSSGVNQPLTPLERARIDQSGRLSVGSSVTALNAVQIQGAGQATTSVSDSGDGSALFLADTGSAGNNGGLLLFGASVINGHRPQVGIKSVLTDGAAYGTADMIFVTRTTTAATTLSEKMRLTKDGKLGIGITPAATLHVEGAAAQARFSTAAASDARHEYYRNGVREAYINWDLDTFQIYGTKSGGSLLLGTNSTERLRIKSTGQLNLVGLNSAPTGAVGDLYYNSTSNTLQYHNNSAFQQISRKYTVALNDGSVTVVGNAYTLTHNMGSKDITVSVRRTTDDVVVLTDVSMPSTTTATITFAAAITASQYVVTVIG